MGTKKRSSKVTPRFKLPLRKTFFVEWREYRGLTQAQAAERVSTFLEEHGLAKGYTHASIQRLENNIIRYTQPILEALAYAYNTDPASLLMRDPTESEAMWSIWDQAQQADRQKIVEIAKTITGRTGTEG